MWFIKKTLKIFLILIFLFALCFFSWSRHTFGTRSRSVDAYEKITINGETARFGIYDPSVEYEQSGETGWLAYSAVENPGYIHTHLAQTSDNGRTWTKMKELNVAEDGIVGDIEGVWRHETPTLVYDSGDTGKEWKLFWVKGFSKPPHLPLDTLWDYLLIMYKYSSDPLPGVWSEEISLFRSNPLPPPYTARYDLNDIHPSETYFRFFMEPGVIAKDGVLYLSLHGVPWSLQEGEIFLIASNDHGDTWGYTGTLAGYNDAQDLGYDVLTSPSLVEENGRFFLLASPKTQPYSYSGVYIFEFEDILQAELKRNINQKIIVYKYIEPVSAESIGGGQSGYDTNNTYGGVMMSQSAPTAPLERYQIFNTKEMIIQNSNPPSAPKSIRIVITGMQ